MNKFLSAYYPAIILFAVSLVVALCTYQHYGVAWDEPLQRDEALLSYNYLAYGSQQLFIAPNDYHGSGFELLLLGIEKAMHISDSRDIYLMRHLVSHIFFLLGAFVMYALVYRLFNSRVLAAIGFLMLVLMPRIYAHSFFNSKDVPFLVMFIFAFAIAQAAFDRSKAASFLLLGIICGYATSIRIMGIMLYGVFAAFLLLDITYALVRRQKVQRLAVHLALLTLGFCLMLYVSWPYLHKAPLHTFIDGYKALSHFNWDGRVLFQGRLYDGSQLPLSYFPVWFAITTPIVWMVVGIAGLLFISARCLRSPLSFFKNPWSRNFLLYLICFVAPIAGIIAVHSVIYDDWRHLYFVYPSFVLLSVYIINMLWHSRYKVPVLCGIGLQAAFVLYFMIDAHPFQQIYFNSLVSHKKEYLRNNFDLEYWSCSYKQALDFLVAYDHSDTIKVAWRMNPLYNNTLILKKEDRMHIAYREWGDADYLITNFRLEPADLSFPVLFSIRKLNSTIMCVYKIR